MGAGGYVGAIREAGGQPCGQARGQAELVHPAVHRVVHGPSVASRMVPEGASTYPRVRFLPVRLALQIMSLGAVILELSILLDLAPCPAVNNAYPAVWIADAHDLAVDKVL